MPTDSNMRRPSIAATIKQGHGVASGNTDNSPYPRGTIEMQIPFFKNLGLDLSALFKGTLNLNIEPHTFEMISPEFTFRKVHWTDGFPPEDFSFSSCAVLHQGWEYNGYIYYPHPETKIGHFHSSSLIEVICEPIDGIGYGDRVELRYREREVRII